MGVHGLWKLIEPSGKPVPLETLENKVLAVDVSIWLHQAVRGFQDSKGAPLPNAHLLGIYHRVCKLLYFRVKPVFIFDGGVPVLKKETIAKRSQLKSKNQSEADRIHKHLLNTILKHTAISKVLSERTKAAITATQPAKKLQTLVTGEDDDKLYQLPPSQMDITSSSSSSDEDSVYISESMEDSSSSSPTKQWDLHSIDTQSSQFKSLPLEVRHEILSDLKETRKQSSWGRINELPTESNDFAVYQMKRLLKRQSVQTALEEAEKEMGGHSLSLGELEMLLKYHGVITTNNSVGSRIASDENTRYLLIKNIKQAIEDAKNSGDPQSSSENQISSTMSEKRGELVKSKADLEFENDLERAIALSLQNEPSTSKNELPSTLQGLPSTSQGLPSTSQSLSSTSKAMASTGQGLEPEGTTEDLLLAAKDLPPASEVLKSVSEGLKSRLEDLGSPCQGLGSIPQDLEVIPQGLGSTSEDLGSTPQSLESTSEGLGSTPQGLGSAPQGLGSTSESLGSAPQDLRSSSQEIMESKFQNLLPTDQNVPSTSAELPSTSRDAKSKRDQRSTINEKKLRLSFLEDFTDADFNNSDSSEEMEEVVPVKKFCSAQSYMMEYSGLTPSEIAKIINKNSRNPRIVSTKESKNSHKIGTDEPKKKIPTILEGKEAKNEDVIEIMSDSNSNSSVEEFLDVSESSLKPKETGKSLEIVINTKESIEDDLFGDIFDNVLSKPEEESVEPTKSLPSDGTLEMKQNESEKTTDTISLKEKVEKSFEAVKNNDEKQTSSLFAKTKPDGGEEVVENDNIVGKMIKEYSTIDNQTELSVAQLNEMKNNLRKEEIELITEKSVKERMASNITDQMYQEAQELLELFGVPYIVAPMEAEAQCAFLNEINLTDGTITDDSDIWLFGGKTVYKNFFSHHKHVKEFKAENIQHHFKLSREQMILLALLVGSDYTTGLQGIGPVTALEILAAFPPSKSTEFTLTQFQLISGLAEFKSWFNKGKMPAPGRTSLRNKLKNVVFSEHFPSVQVVQAYLEPKVDTNKEKFSWGKPDIVGLIDFAKQKFGWTKKKSDEILNPVLKRLQDSFTQTKIKDYFKTKFKIDSTGIEAERQMSKRVKIAVNKIGRGSFVQQEEEEDLSKSKQKQKRARKTRKKPESTTASSTGEDLLVVDEVDDESKMLKQAEEEEELSKPKQKRTRRMRKKPESTATGEDLLVVDEADDEMKMLKEIETSSKKKAEEIEKELKNKVQEVREVRIIRPNFRRKEIIPQKEREKNEILRSKLKAIEIFRKSKQGPGFIKTQKRGKRQPKEEAGLSESSSDD